MKSMATAILLMIGVAWPSQIAEDIRPSLPNFICKFAQDWKKAMAKDYPTVDRSILGTAQSCMIKDD